MNHYSFDAVIFDMDGVITKTAQVHARAWKKMFDEYLKLREKKYNIPFREFLLPEDYLNFVDGKPRYKGVASFLESRTIIIPYGNPTDTSGAETVCGLGNRKNEAFNEVIANEGVEVFESTIDLIDQLIAAGIRVGVASSSRNCTNVLNTLGLTSKFGAVVDGEVSAHLGLNGKPSPDIFLKACDLLGSTPDRTVVVEDAASGVQAGSAGGFSFVLGIARENNAVELIENGASDVVNDISELGGIQGLEIKFKSKHKQ
jgi:beta-phosphoglucomutase family hydrolase